MVVNGTEDAALEWDAVNWRLHEDNVRRLRRRIFKAAQEQDLAKVRSLQAAGGAPVPQLHRRQHHGPAHLRE